jgi:Glyoxalase-like domain
MPAKFKDLCLDAVDDLALAQWWCAAMGYALKLGTKGDYEGKWIGAIEDPAGAGPDIWINLVPEAKTLKNRMHLDVYGDQEELIALGATLVRSRDAEIDWDILADPQGNEFCVFAPEYDRYY